MSHPVPLQCVNGTNPVETREYDEGVRLCPKQIVQLYFCRWGSVPLYTASWKTLTRCNPENSIASLVYTKGS